MEKEQKSILCAVAKVIDDGPHGEAGSIIKKGTKHFKAGAKVYVIDAHWRTCDSVTVIGHHRKSGRYIKIDMRAKHLKELSLKYVYSPKITELIEEHFSDRNGLPSEEYARQIVEALPQWP